MITLSMTHFENELHFYLLWHISYTLSMQTNITRMIEKAIHFTVIIFAYTIYHMYVYACKHTHNKEIIKHFTHVYPYA